VNAATQSVEQRAQRLLRCYPRRWRDQYGEEFAELLAADLAERPRSIHRTLDIACHGVLARLSVIGLGGSPIGRPQAALATIGAAIIGFLACGVSLWSQLLIGWRSSPPDSRAVSVGVLVMSIAVVYLAALAVLAAAPVIAAALRSVRRGEARRFVGPSALVVVGIAILIVGGQHVAAGLPSQTGHAWQLQRLVPGRLASFGRAETLAISTYWVHPSTLLALPTTQLGWMILSPAALAATVIGSIAVVRRVTLGARALAYESRLATSAAVGMVPYLAAGAWWVLASHRGPTGVFQAGSLDLLLIAVMAAALTVARSATEQLCPLSAA
jgi:hypothetical protein